MSDLLDPILASLVILKRGDKAAFLLRTNTSWMNGYYGLAASGTVEANESFSKAAVREALEETGVQVRKEDLKYVHTMHYRGDKNLVYVIFEVLKWAGEPRNAEPDQHGDLAWFDLKNLPDTIVPPIRFALEQIEAGKTYSEFGWDEP